MIPNTPRLTYETKGKRWIATLNDSYIGTVSDINGTQWKWEHADGTTGTGTESQCIRALTRHMLETTHNTHHYQ